ncbi:hypothetical protein DSO57_1006863 [Entomophthora muscae]|uniref:Uncharacterized protein n=1 Tax=Entomophthora muscae TaxID=34485 RepID=A0ACC2SKV4_9FUNG|nr:hypothetical protein DSO57_1006863 [Entomophthora muscae]
MAVKGMQEEDPRDQNVLGIQGVFQGPGCLDNILATISVDVWNPVANSSLDADLAPGKPWWPGICYAGMLQSLTIKLMEEIVPQEYQEIMIFWGVTDQCGITVVKGQAGHGMSPSQVQIYGQASTHNFKHQGYPSKEDAPRAMVAQELENCTAKYKDEEEKPSSM